jgi:DNA polymerase III subunit epsilon
MLPAKLAFVDIETTGTRAGFDRIIEIGIVRVEDNKIVQSYQTLINPEAYLPPEIQSLTGITSLELTTAPTFREVAPDILNLLKDAVFVAHNVRFDYSFLKGEFRLLEKTFSSKHFCTVKLSRFLYPQHRHHNLDSIIERFGFTCKNRHRAFDDASILFSFYQHIQKEFPQEHVEHAIQSALKKTFLPPRLTNDVVELLPESPGVYIFYGENSTPLYIGKSINIKERVLSHFSGDLRSPIEMKINQQIERIETIQTAGELGALFLESQLIKTMLPLYNRMLRVKHELIAVKYKEDAQGYQTIYLEPITAIDPNDLPSFLGFFKSRKQAKDFLVTVMDEHDLCEKLLGLEKSNSACFGYRLDKCKGACIGEEAAIRYNMRFLHAFSHRKIKPWPFRGPILIDERNPFDGKIDTFIIDKWCYVGSVSRDHEENVKKNALQIQQFDLDIYKILMRYFKKPAHMRTIRLMNSQDTNLFSGLS